ncbi:MAG: hypothetical protein IPK66_03840 [Rhodospirillales bacterium]|nr:hypothetical protein [Rhodospirillales bacterium]
MLFGETLPWSIRGMWVNVLDTGGHQAPHIHANSFISVVAYLTRPHPSTLTVFLRRLGGSEFVFSNHNKNASINPFNGEKWIVPTIDPGDVILFPSYLLHQVPTNRGERRITIAFNAVPSRLDNWGYKVRFSG